LLLQELQPFPWHEKELQPALIHAHLQSRSGIMKARQSSVHIPDLEVLKEQL
jgi:hypothetical protein